jgi:DNA-binding HxlR family transcriptional regulator
MIPMSGPPGSRRKTAVATLDRPEDRPACCPHFHRAVELVGKRWTGAILYVLLHSERPLRFSEIGHAVPDLSDRLLSERMKELEKCGIVRRKVAGTSPIKVEYALTDRGRELEPALAEISDWANRWMASGSN